MALRNHAMSAMKATFLIAAHHNVALRPQDLPRLVVVAILPNCNSAILDPAAEAMGLQTLTRAVFEEAWDGRILLARPKG